MINVIAFILFISSFIIWWIYGKDEKIKDVNVNDALNSIDIFEAILAYDGEAQDNDVVAILLHMINSGLITINKDKTLSTNYDYSKANSIEACFLENLFGRAGKVNLSENKNRVNDAFNALKLRMNEVKKKKKFFVGNSLDKKKFIFVNFILILILGVTGLLIEFIPNIFGAVFFATFVIAICALLWHIIKDIGKKHMLLCFFAKLFLFPQNIFLRPVHLYPKVYTPHPP